MNSKLLSAIALAGLLASSQTFAVAPAPVCPSMTAGGITINECVYSATYGFYEVTNLSGQSIYSFAVSTQNTNTTASFQREGWNGLYFTESNWNEEFGADTFDKTFGTEDTGAYYYWGKFPIVDGATRQGFFGFYGQPYSNFVAYNQSGSVIAQSYTAAVPEPETYAMLLAGLGVLGFMGKRRKAS